MQRSPCNSGRKHEQGIIITLVAIFMLFIVGAMAALSIDVVTFYTARSEAQIAADGAALAGARVLANTGMTSSTDPIAAPALAANAKSLAVRVAILVAQQNQVGGQKLAASEVSVTTSDTCSTTAPAPLYTNPCVTVRVQRTDLPTFFARIWGTTTVTVAASATAEAYNPSGLATVSGSSVAPVAPSCVKPWLLPNMDPKLGGAFTIFDRASGAISDPLLLGWDTGGVASTTRLQASTSSTPSAWQYYPEDETGFPTSQDVPECATGLDSRQQSIAGCVQTPVICGTFVGVATGTDPTTLNGEAATAVDCLTNTKWNPNGGDQISTTLNPPSPFQFSPGDSNPLVMSGALTASANIMISNSLVTVPVFDNSTWTSTTPPTSVQVIGFVQVFLQPLGNAVPPIQTIRTKVINMVGCGANLASSTAVPVYGNGPSAVPVRLISTSPAN